MNRRRTPTSRPADANSPKARSKPWMEMQIARCDREMKTLLFRFQTAQRLESHAQIPQTRPFPFIYRRSNDDDDAA